MRSAIERLGPRDREILVMRFLEQMAVPDIAATLGITAKAVRGRQLRALRHLRNILDDAVS